MVFGIIGNTDPTEAADNPTNWAPGMVLLESGKVAKPTGILQLDFHYDARENPTITFQNATRMNGYPPKSKKKGITYTLGLFDQDGRRLMESIFTHPASLFDPPPRPGEIAKLPEINALDFTVTVADIAGATGYEIRDQDNRRILSGTLPDQIPTLHHEPKYSSIFGRDLKQKKSVRITDNLFPFITRAYAQYDGAVDIVFINDNIGSTSISLSDLSIFRTNVITFVNHFILYEPFRTRLEQMNFHYIENTSDLFCLHNSSIVRLITCNYTSVTQAVNAATVPYDQIVVIVNDQQYGGSGGGISVAYNGEEGPQVFVHEFGHTFGILWDEYTLYNDPGQITGNHMNNCYPGTPPSTAWRSWVGDTNIQYTLGCMYPNYYRSSQSSIMLQLSSQYFNPVSEYLLNTQIDQVAGPLNGTSPTPIVNKPGDANGDSRVNGVDYMIWLFNYGKNLNQPVSGPLPGPYSAYGDFDGNALVDGRDYMIWLNNYGT